MEDRRQEMDNHEERRFFKSFSPSHSIKTIEKQQSQLAKNDDTESNKENTDSAADTTHTLQFT